MSDQQLQSAATGGLNARRLTWHHIGSEPLVGLILRQFNHTEGLHLIAYFAALDPPRDVALDMAALLRERLARGTRRDRRSPGCFKPAVLALRWFLDRTRISPTVTAPYPSRQGVAGQL